MTANTNFSFVDEPSNRVDGESVRVEREQDETVTVAVTRALESLSGDLSPGVLHESVDPDALNTLFRDRRDGTSRVGGEVAFRVDNCVVTVRDGEEILVERT